MQALVLQRPGAVGLERVPYPVCGADDVLLRVDACGICGSDVRAVFDGDRFSEVTRIPGHEPAGTVVEIGSQVTRWKIGDRLALAADIHCGDCFYCRRELFNLCEQHQILGKHVDGALAEYMLLSGRLLANGIVHRVPPGVSQIQATLAEPISSVLASHDALRIQSGEKAVVIGSGTMAILHAILLRSCGVRVLILGRSQNRLNLATCFSPDAAVSSEQLDWERKVLAFTDDMGADVTICAAPAPSLIARAPFFTRKRGRIGLFAGLPRALSSVALDLNRIHYAEQSLVGNFSYHPRHHLSALGLLRKAVLDSEKLITTYPLSLSEQALLDIRSGRVLKAVITPAS